MKKKIAILGSTGSNEKNFINILKKDKKNIEITFQEIFAVLHKIQYLDPIGIGLTSKSFYI